MQSAVLEEGKPQGSGRRKIDLEQEELRDWSSDPGEPLAV